jgi:hypothetical protein
MTRKIDYLGFRGFCGVTFSGNSDLYAASQRDSDEIVCGHTPGAREEAARRWTYGDPQSEEFYIDFETGRFGPRRIFFPPNPKIEQLRIDSQRRQFRFNPETRQLDPERNPFRPDPESGIIYRGITIEKDGRTETFIEQRRRNNTIFRWKMTVGDSPIFPSQLPDSCPQKANDKLVINKIMSCIGNKDLKSLKEILNQLDNSELFIDRHPHLLHRVREALGRASSEDDVKINQKILKIFMKFGYYDADDELDYRIVI